MSGRFVPFVVLVKLQGSELHRSFYPKIHLRLHLQSISRCQRRFKDLKPKFLTKNLHYVGKNCPINSKKICTLLEQLFCNLRKTFKDFLNWRRIFVFDPFSESEESLYLYLVHFQSLMQLWQGSFKFKVKDISQLMQINSLQHCLEWLSRNRFFVDEVCCNRLRKEFMKKVFAFALLLQIVPGPVLHEGLQVVGVLLHTGQKIVHDITGFIILGIQPLNIALRR